MPDQALPFPLPVVPPKFTPLTAAAQNRQLAKKLYADFFDWPIERSRKILETTPPEVWEREGQKRALQVFHAAAERVPAYKDFLRKNKINHSRIRSVEDFRAVPWVDKKDYLRQYSLEDLSWDGQLASSQMISVSSGSSGEPLFWPRGTYLEMETTFLHDLFLTTFFSCDRVPTLFVDSFSMGMYVAGPITLNSTLRMSQKGYPIRVVTPGIEMADILKVIPGLKNNHEQIVIAGYPPFIKDVLDEGIRIGLSLGKPRIKFLLAGEGYSETWRDYVAELAGASDPMKDFINLYGTADAAVLAHETPLSVRIRRLAASDERLREALFQSGRLPSFLQYYPTLRYFETVNRELLFTASAGVPLVRYNIHDLGGVLTLSQVIELARLRNNGFVNALRLSRAYNSSWKLPFVYLLGKSDFTATLYGLNIYPENIRAALEQPKIRQIVTGRFTMSTEYRRNHSQYLLVNVELAAGMRSGRIIHRKILSNLIGTLDAINAEYHKLSTSIGRRARPVVRLFPKGDVKHFPRQGKQRWIHQVKK